MTHSAHAIQQATLAVAVFDAGWPVPDLRLQEADSPEELSPVRTWIGKALADLDAVPAESRPIEAIAGLRLLVAFVLAPRVIGGAPSVELDDEAREYALYIASYVTGAEPSETLRTALEAVEEWLRAATVQRAILAVADQLEYRRVVMGVETEQLIRAMLPE